MLVKCDKYPNLIIFDEGIRFVSGEATLKNDKQAAICRRMDEDGQYGFVFTEQAKPKGGAANGKLPDTRASK